MSTHLFFHSRRITSLRDKELEREFCHLRPLEQGLDRALHPKAVLLDLAMQCPDSRTVQAVSEVTHLIRTPLAEIDCHYFSTRDLSMADFLEEDDRTVFGTNDRDLRSTETGYLYRMADLVNINIANSFPTLQKLHAHLDELDLLDSEHLRPSWDTYFMVGCHVQIFSFINKSLCRL
jgi:signal transduction histidine kinase